MDDYDNFEELVPTSQQRPDADGLAAFLQGPLDVRSLSLSILMILAIGTALYVARAVLMPIVLAVLLSFLLSPVVRLLAEIRLPEAVGAAVVLFAIVGLVALGSYGLWEPASRWVEQLPHSISQIEVKVRSIKQSVEELSEATKRVEKMTKMESEAAPSPPKVEVQRPSLTRTVFNQTLDLMAVVGAVTVLLYFLLASGDLFLLKLVRILPRFEDKKIAVAIVHEVRHDISHYLSTVTLINAGLGAAAGIAMFGLGMPNPLLWGIMVAVFNFIPYLGATASTLILTIVAILTFDELGRALLVPAVFMGLTVLEGCFVTPSIVGRRLTLNPVAIFIWLTFWGWLWGIPGMLLAVPLLATLKIICDYIRPLNPVGELLGD
jgi:predicted PurR-regulated permease PerM